MALFLNRFRSRESPALVERPGNRASIDARLAAIVRSIAHGGGKALSAADSKIWNTAVVISYLSSEPGGHVPGNAKVLSWAAARAGFQEMGLPVAAAFVTSLVTELAFRTEIDPRDRQSEAASLLRLAGLKRQFAAIEAKHDLWALLRRSLLD